MSVPGSQEQLGELLDEFLERDLRRFEVRHARARSEAGPSLMGGPRGIEHWTYEYVRRQVDDCLRDASMVVLEYASETGVETPSLIPVTQARLAAHFKSIVERLRAELNGPAAHEYDVRPSPEALRQAELYADQRLRKALSAIGRGRLEPSLALRIGLVGRLVEKAGGGQKLLLYSAAALFCLVMYSFF
jgi:hypothetical protein